ncbi:LOW QUALITY PROTEIN: putative peptidyl-tRNA hydrolase PTRHD1 [Pocillopora verrucosa]|uniref:LOW QUALITY PROTEIN: putative peptidyl-tRNA hydrolase PTRHD1 n=1 Tax=Pocillopora verrucosa TaxID=203993 RepID=UPI003342C9FA
MNKGKQVTSNQHLSNCSRYDVVRGDLLSMLSWPIGAVIAQSCHASTAALWMHRDDSNTLQYTSDLDNKHKVVVEAPSPDELGEIIRNYATDEIDHNLWIEQSQNIPTCLATQPYPKQQIHSYLQSLNLF